MRYSIKKIKQAFYEKFEKERTFRYLGNEGKIDDQTDRTWNLFVKKLDEKQERIK